MKKYSFKMVAMSVAALAVISACTNGQLTLDETEPKSDIPSELVAKLDSEPMIKSAYDDAGSFSWLSSDHVSLILAEDLSSYGILSSRLYEIKSLSEENKVAVFKATDANEELNAYVDGSLKNTGIAVYPSTLAVKDNNNRYGAPYVVLPQSVSGVSSEIVLTGVPFSTNSNYKFSTAMSVISFTLNNIPASAAQVRLYTNTDSYPLDGDFKLVKGEDGKVAISSSNYAGNAHDYVYVDLSTEGAIDSRTFFFNIPVADYPAGTMYILLCDANGGQIMKRTVNVALSLSRNDCLDFPTLAYAGTVEFSEGSEYNPRVAWSIDCKQIRFCVSTSETNDPSAYDANYVFTNPKTTGRYSGTNDLTSYSSNKPSVSGKYYLHYILQSDDSSVPSSLDANNVVSYGTLPFYYSSEDYDFDGMYICGWTDGGSPSNSIASSYVNDDPTYPRVYGGNDTNMFMVLAESDDYTKGTLMLTTMFGVEGTSPMYGYYDESANKIIFPYPGDEEENMFYGQQAKDTDGTYYIQHYHVARGTEIKFKSSQSPYLADPLPVMDLEFTIGESYDMEYSGWGTVPKIRALIHNDCLILKYYVQYIQSYGYANATPKSEFRAKTYGKGIPWVKGQTPQPGQDGDAGGWM